MPPGQKTKTYKQKQYCNKFKKDFLNGPHQNKQKNFFLKKGKAWKGRKEDRALGLHMGKLFSMISIQG